MGIGGGLKGRGRSFRRSIAGRMSAYPEAAGKEEDGGGGDGGNGDFGFGEKGEAEEKASQEEKKDRALRRGAHPACGRSPLRGKGRFQRGIESQEGEKGEEKAAGKFVRIRGEEVVVADAEVTVEGKKKNAQRDCEGGDSRTSHAAEECAEGEEGGEPEGKVQREKGMDGGVSEQRKKGGVEIDGKGTEIISEVAVEDVAARDAPGDVEFAGEVDEGVGPGEPGGVEGEGGEEDVEEQLEDEEDAGGVD